MKLDSLRILKRSSFEIEIEIEIEGEDEIFIDKFDR